MPYAMKAQRRGTCKSCGCKLISDKVVLVEIQGESEQKAAAEDPHAIDMSIPGNR